MISSRSICRPSRAVGLTLIELSVAVATGAILVVMVGSVLLASTRVSDAIQKESSARKVAVTLRRITESLQRSGNSRITIDTDLAVLDFPREHRREHLVQRAILPHRTIRRATCHASCHAGFHATASWVCNASKRSNPISSRYAR